MQFTQIYGHAETKQLLINSVNNRHVAHAQLFLGSEGSANLALALAYATYINCETRTGEDSCGTCASCNKMNKLVHPDMNFVMPVTTTKSVAKEPLSSKFLKEWREFVLANPYQSLNDWMQFIGAENKQGNISKEESVQLIRVVSLKAFEAEFKVIVIWLPELMHPAASNALLKLLEEPPGKTVFLLVANAPEKLLATILSRTQIVKVRPFSDDEITGFLQENYGTDDTTAYQISQLAEGNLHMAMQLINEIGNDYFTFFADWMRSCYGYNFIRVVELTDEFQKMGRENQKNFLHYALTIFRKVMLYGIDSVLLAYVPPAEQDFVSKFSKFVHQGNASLVVNELNDAHYHIERNANPKMIFLDTSIQLARLLRMPVEQLV